MSCVAVDVDGVRSEVFKISEGMKQAGVLSSFLFNFFMDALLERLLKLDIGAIIGDTNTSAVAYCDDFSLMSPVEGHMEILLDYCSSYSGITAPTSHPHLTGFLFMGAGAVM